MVSNPLGLLIPSAHAWSWDGVWEGVKEGIGYLIPYEDFITIGQQLIYLANNDSRFDATTLAFASVGAATIIPIAKPLKPLLGPIKRVVDGMRRFPGAKHFAGAIGTAVKMGLSGKTEKLANLMPFILIIAEVYNDPEAFEFILSAIESEEDLWTWVEYIAEVVKVEGGLDALASYNGNIQTQEFQLASNPLSFLINDAHAKSTSAIGRIFSERIKSLKKSIDLSETKEVTRALREVFRDADLKKLVASKTSALRIFAAVGTARIAKFIRNSKDWRINRWLVLVCLIYLAEEADEGHFNVSSDSQFTSLLGNLFSDSNSNYNGAVFQIVQTAYYHAQHRADNSRSPKVAGIDVKRGAYYLVGGKRSGEPYRRQVDILLEYGDGTEEWVELKSYSTDTIKSNINANADVFKGTTPMREFFHDYRLNDYFITADPRNRDAILRVDNRVTKTNKTYIWHFQDYSIPKGDKNKKGPPHQNQIDNAREKLCKKPKNVSESDYKYNFKNKDSVASTCKSKAATQVGLRDTKSYFTDVLDKIGSEFALQVKEELLGVE